MNNYFIFLKLILLTDLLEAIAMPIYNIDGETLNPIRQVKFKNERELQKLT